MPHTGYTTDSESHEKTWVLSEIPMPFPSVEMRNTHKPIVHAQLDFYMSIPIYLLTLSGNGVLFVADLAALLDPQLPDIFGNILCREYYLAYCAII